MKKCMQCGKTQKYLILDITNRCSDCSDAEYRAGLSGFYINSDDWHEENQNSNKLKYDV